MHSYRTHLDVLVEHPDQLTALEFNYLKDRLRNQLKDMVDVGIPFIRPFSSVKVSIDEEASHPASQLDNCEFYIEGVLQSRLDFKQTDYGARYKYHMPVDVTSEVLGTGWRGLWRHFLLLLKHGGKAKIHQPVNVDIYLSNRDRVQAVQKRFGSIHPYGGSPVRPESRPKIWEDKVV